MLFIISQVLLDFAGCQKLGVKREAKRKLHCSRRNVPRLSSMKVCCAWKKKMKNCFVAFHFFAWEEKQSYLKTAKNMWSWLVSKSVIQAQLVDVPPKVLKSAKIREFLQSRGFLCSICMPLTRWRKCKSTHALKLHFSDIWGICVTKKNIYKNKKRRKIVRIRHNS